MRTLSTYLLAALLLAAGPAFAQIVQLRGTVRDATGNPVPFASVTVAGTRNTVSADADGNWTIQTALPVRLTFAASGYSSETINVSGSTRTVTCTLTQANTSLETVVVTTGLGTRRVTELPGYSYTPSYSTPKKEPVLHAGARGVGEESDSEGSHTAGGHLLTAGEVSDFKKWKLWGDYSDKDFQSGSAAWKMTFRKRYCLQVQNHAQRAVLNEPVYLVAAASGDTIWSARTDNTGKAELWGDAYEGPGSGLWLHCGGQVLPATAFSNGINAAVLDKPCAASKEVDVAFVVDATGSMGDEITYLQAELGAVIRETRTAHPDIQLRLGSVFYRDADDSYLTRCHKLGTDAESLLRFIEKQSAGGGGDIPEAVDAALSVALDSLGWSSEARSRILFLVLDAPPHADARARMALLARQAARMGVRIVPVVCSGADKPTEYLMRCLALASNGTYTFLTDDSGIGGAHLKPTTDEFKVELLADLMKRLLNEMCYAADCSAPEEAPGESVSLPRVKVYPNPARSFVNLESKKAIKDVYLADFAGKLLQRLSMEKGSCRVDLQAYPSGTYLLRYFMPGKGWGSEKIVLLR